MVRPEDRIATTPDLRVCQGRIAVASVESDLLAEPRTKLDELLGINEFDLGNHESLV